MIELGRFEHTASTGRNSDGRNPNASNTDVSASAAAQDSNSANDTSSGTNASTGRNNRRRFTAFHFRKRAHTHNHSVSGPALAVVDAEPSPATDSANKDKDEVHGVRVTIRLVALDEQGTELASPNEQVTYLHVVRFGTAVEEGEEDARSWVVRVVKREATVKQMIVFVYSHSLIKNSSRLVLTLSTSTRYTVYPRNLPTPQHPPHLFLPNTPILLQLTVRLPQQPNQQRQAKTNSPANACSVFPPREKSSYSHVAIW